MIMNNYEYKGTSLLEDFQPSACIYFKEKDLKTYHHFYVSINGTTKAISLPTLSYSLKDAIEKVKGVS